MKQFFLTLLICATSFLFSQEQQESELTNTFGNEFYLLAPVEPSIAKLVGEKDPEGGNYDVFDISNSEGNFKYLIHLMSEKTDDLSAITLDNYQDYLSDQPTILSSTLSDDKVKLELAYSSNDFLRATLYLWKTGDIYNKLLVYYDTPENHSLFGLEVSQMVAQMEQVKDAWPY